ncbi:MAG: FIG138315: Putative alpha helix protein [uncultured Thiotrichaceae bacterium]|uniref:Dual-action ribosomal maturation protein DarP n=1 Tax=uncultured Thiotrichaceae bacterium TaxID=298394 RepID=A0A6S6SEX4_9GAMM|nr:MAG: FIG138315: Putative alpha helix protein [uncultured Thiotrichaceae bacterium]
MVYDEDGYAIRKNKTALKRDLIELREMAKEIMTLNEEQIRNLPMDERLQNECVYGKRMRKEALRRQLIFLERLMNKEEDTDAIRQALDDLKRPKQAEVALFHQLEVWRDKLLNNDAALLEELLEKYPVLERQSLRQFLRNAEKEKAQNKPPKSSRALFKYLRSNITL